MGRLKIFYAIVIISLLTLLFPISIMADAAPPDVPNGENLDPGESSTMVQMVAEEVIIDVGLTHEVLNINEYGDYFEGYAVAYNCTFWMQNRGTETENLAVRFPIRSGFEFGTIHILSIKVNDQPTPWVEDEERSLDIDSFQWAHFNAVFPPGEEVEIRVTYTSITRGGIENPQQRLSYILETGAGWYGPIGQGRIILRLPYKATPENLILAYTNTPEGVFTDSDVYWEFKDLEPTSEDNWGLMIVAPDLWLQILTERNRLDDAPNNVSAMKRLAEYIFKATVNKGVEVFSQTLHEEGLETIKRAISLNPDDIAGHEIFLEYLRADYSMESAALMLDEANLVLALDPDNNAAINCKELALLYLGRFETATSWAIATSTPTTTPLPTATQTFAASTSTEVAFQKSSPTESLTQILTTDEENETTPHEKDNELLIIGLVLISLGVLLFFGRVIIQANNRKNE